ncbi:CLUMA_CG020422, isoform A [Clunio marinus]|uniref:CLUMA_CG020422, isoform A n=1 Tax=Clunio marinus TaxID=568069 RepID=A0A1J1J4W7_9DIPT|nr:CLUMA_CG020422, isoform A [Clunio marinus]
MEKKSSQVKNHKNLDVKSNQKIKTKPETTAQPAHHSQACNIMYDVEKLKTQLDALFEGNPNDPEYQNNANKLKEIKTFLENETNDSTRQENPSKIFPDIINVNLDESLLCVVDQIIKLYEVMKEYFQNQRQ